MCHRIPVSDSSNLMMETTLNHAHGADLGYLHLKTAPLHHLLMGYVVVVAAAVGADGENMLHPS